MITADTITDEQIRELLEDALSMRDMDAVVDCRAALGSFDLARGACRARCAERLNARDKEAQDFREWEYSRQPEQRVKRDPAERNARTKEPR